MNNRMTKSSALATLVDGSGRQFAELFKHGSLVVEIYRPERIDRQQPHSRDELYVIIAGTGKFVNGDQVQEFEPGEVLFVPAGVAHRFEEFSDDFCTWVMFYGPEGGEARC
jgi:mannose-6-phosphate isomerase-like protein (cupin superfamily)